MGLGPYSSLFLLWESIGYLMSQNEMSLKVELLHPAQKKQDSHAVTRELRNAAAVVFGLKFADNIHYKF